MTVSQKACAFFASLLWGSTLPLAKISLNDMSPFSMQSLRMFMVAAIFIPSLKKLPLREMPKVLVMSLGMFSLFFGINTYCLTQADSSIVTFVCDLDMPLAALMGVIFLKERMGMASTTGWLFVLLGAGLIYNVASFQQAGSAMMLLLFAVLVSAATQVFVKRSITIPASQLMPWCYVLAAPQLFLFAILFESNPMGQWLSSSPSTLLTILGSGLISFLAYTLWTSLLQKAPISQVSIFGLLISPLGIGLNALILQEYPTLDVVAGGMLVIFGIYVQQWEAPCEPEMNPKKQSHKV